MRRWISAAGVTLAVLVLAFFAFGAVGKEARGAAVHESSGEVAVVSIVRRHKAKPAHTAAEKNRPKTPPKESAPTIPAASEPPAEPEEAAAEETPDDAEAESAETAAANDAESVSGAENAEGATEIAAADGAETASDAKSTAGTAADSYGAGEDAERSYKSYALSRIAGKKRYPAGARSRGQQGKVKLRIVIEPDGTLSEAGFVHESEFELLNEASLAAVRKSAPFKKMPHGMRRQEYVFVIDYSLE
ncbi:MAG: energy transducer TonB [Treponema sp.]|nr:energy transducer TonB [Treponema sp.]